MTQNLNLKLVLTSLVVTTDFCQPSLSAQVSFIDQHSPFRYVI